MKVSKLKGIVFESAVIERYRCREQSVEEFPIYIHLAGASARQVDDISQLLWGDRMSSQMLSDKLKRVYGQIDQWHDRPPEGEYPYVFMDGVWHKRSWGGSVGNVSVLVAIGVDQDGHREIIAVDEGMREDRASWEQSVRSMIECELRGRALGGRRPVRRAHLHHQLQAAGCKVPALHGAFHAQRADQGAARSPAMGIRLAQGHIRHGILGPRPRQGRAGRQTDGGTQAQGCRQLPGGRRRRDDHLSARRVPE